jgi:hypothetical protein
MCLCFVIFPPRFTITPKLFSWFSLFWNAKYFNIKKIKHRDENVLYTIKSQQNFLSFGNILYNINILSTCGRISNFTSFSLI